MNNEHKKILDFCNEYFLTKGFYKTTMDEIASELRMSKKTIYKYYPTKYDLVRKAITKFLEFHKKSIAKIVNNNADAVTKLNEILIYIGNFIAKIDERFIKDIQSHMPDLWEDIDSFRTKMMNVNIGKIIDQGKKEGFFIDKSSAIITGVFISAVRGVINPDFIMNNKFSFKSALEETIEIILNGIMTEKGKKKFSQLKTESSNENN